MTMVCPVKASFTGDETPDQSKAQPCTTKS
jgi:hypothetical protein